MKTQKIPTEEKVLASLLLTALITLVSLATFIFFSI